MADQKIYDKIKAEYIRGGTSYKKLSEKYGVSLSSIKRRASAGKWVDLLNQSENKANQKIVESVAQKKAKEADKIQTVADLLLLKITDGIADGTLIIDARDLRAVTSALKDLKDIKGYKSELDMQEQIARIDKLRKEAQKDEEANKEIKVIIGGDLEAYSV